MTRQLYTILLRAFSPLIWTWMRVRAGKKSPEWEILAPSRFGRYTTDDIKPQLTKDGIWIHAVSLGETRAAQPLVKMLLEQGRTILLTHTTPTGRAEGERLFSEAIASGQLQQTWLPYDFPGSVRRFIQRFMPRCGILIEREVWPNLIHEARAAGVSVLLVSARFSASSLKQSWWLGSALRRAYSTLDLVLAQTEADASRLREVGAYGPHVVGNLKFDVSLAPSQLEAGRRWRQSVARPLVAIASTRDGEEQIFAESMQRVSGGQDTGAALYMLIPRHPQRFGDVGMLLEKQGLKFVRRSAGGDIVPPSTPVLLGDTIGEMAFYYAAADVAIIGGGFEPLGGQNLIEACAAGTPVIVGPHMYNFAQATHDAIAAGAAIQVADMDQALHTAYELLRDAPRREAMRRAALNWTATHAGATRRIVTAMRPWLGSTADGQNS